MMHTLTLFWAMLVGHAVCDYPLQGDFLARGKNHKAPIPDVPWWICLMAHSVIHGGMVSILTGTLTLGVAEAVTHSCIDWFKCDGRTSFEMDQILHILCKGIWITIIVAGVKLP